MSATQVKMERETMFKWKKAYEEEAQCHATTAINLQKIINKYEAENTKLRECVEFYADEKNYSPEYLRQGVLGRHGKQALFLDGGKRARQVLKELEDK